MIPTDAIELGCIHTTVYIISIGTTTIDNTRAGAGAVGCVHAFGANFTEPICWWGKFGNGRGEDAHRMESATTALGTCGK